VMNSTDLLWLNFCGAWKIAARGCEVSGWAGKRLFCLPADFPVLQKIRLRRKKTRLTQPPNEPNQLNN